jgi:hypothetical protein
MAVSTIQWLGSTTSGTTSTRRAIESKPCTTPSWPGWVALFPAQARRQSATGQLFGIAEVARNLRRLLEYARNIPIELEACSRRLASCLRCRLTHAHLETDYELLRTKTAKLSTSRSITLLKKSPSIRLPTEGMDLSTVRFCRNIEVLRRFCRPAPGKSQDSYYVFTTVAKDRKRAVPN